MRGRKSKPTYLKVLDGSAGRPGSPGSHKRLNRTPACPAHLCSPAKTEWKRLAGRLSELRILTDLDRASLAAYCQAYGRWVEAERKLHETPMLLKLPSGYVQQNPWLTIANKQLELMHKYMSEFGLSPVARSRVSTVGTKSPASKFAGLLGGQRPWLPADEYLSGSRSRPPGRL